MMKLNPDKRTSVAANKTQVNNETTSYRDSGALKIRPSPGTSTCTLALASYLWLYITNIILARNLSVPDFDDYSEAISLVTVMSTIATIGPEKYALRCIPVYRDCDDWPHTRSFLRFSISVILSSLHCWWSHWTSSSTS